MARTIKKMCAVAVVSMTALAARAEVTCFLTVDDTTADEQTYNIYNINVTTDTDWTNSRLELSFCSLTTYTRGWHTCVGFGCSWGRWLDTIFPPSPAFLPAFPNLAQSAPVGPQRVPTASIQAPPLTILGVLLCSVGLVGYVRKRCAA